jgi:hypothetical protein
MKKMKLKGIFLVVGLAMLFAMTLLAHAGEGGPPAGYSYDPPPYSGELVLVFDGTHVTVNGTVKRMGQSGCTGEFNNYSIAYDLLDTDKDFGDLKPNDLQGIVFENTGEVGGIYFSCLGENAQLQVLGVGKLTWISDSAFSASFVIMGLQ